MNRIIPLETKVKVMRESLSLVNVEAMAACYGVSVGAIYYWFNEKVKPALGEILKNDPPGPEPKPAPKAKVTPAVVERPEVCEQCGGRHIWKNGTYWVINWVWLLSIGWLVGMQKALIPRWRCAQCGHELVSVERQRQAEARRAWWQQVKRLIGLSRFKLGLSVRKAQILVAFAYGRQMSVGFIQCQTQQVGKRAQVVLERLSACRQKVAHFMLYDETFPKLGKRAYSLGVVICEYGLIRSVRTMLEMSVKAGTPKTTNCLESKNGLLKPFSRIAKSFRLATAWNFFAGVALMENFDVKSRGLHQGTSAIQRAAINLDDLGASDFFSTVGLNKPQISPATFTL